MIFLETVLPGLLEGVLVSVRQRLWFQHDGAPAHYGEDIRQWLNPGRGTGRAGPIAWPPRSPDLIPMSVFLWKYLKEHVCTDPPRTIEDIVAKLQAAVKMVDTSILRCVLENSVWRTTVCLKMDGGRFKHLLQLRGAHSFIIDSLCHLRVTVYLGN